MLRPFVYLACNALSAAHIAYVALRAYRVREHPTEERARETSPHLCAFARVMVASSVAWRFCVVGSFAAFRSEKVGRCIKSINQRWWCQPGRLSSRKCITNLQTQTQIHTHTVTHKQRTPIARSDGICVSRITFSEQQKLATKTTWQHMTTKWWLGRGNSIEVLFNFHRVRGTLALAVCMRVCQSISCECESAASASANVERSRMKLGAIFRTNIALHIQLNSFYWLHSICRALHQCLRQRSQCRQ